MRPFAEALKRTRAIQDFQGWRVIPLLRGLEVFGVLVFTVARTHYFTVPKVHALESTASRLMPMLLWALAEPS